MSFKEDVSEIDEIATCYQPGLQALAGNSTKIHYQDSRKLEGSVDLDLCVKSIYSNSNRWDYIISYRAQTFFLEVHPATTSEVKVIINKLIWLKKMVEGKGHGFR